MNSSETISIFPYRPGALLWVEGSDSATFLQGQFSNDLRLTEKGKAVYGLWLDVKGKVMADSFIGAAANERGEPGFWIFSYFCPAEVIRSRLEAYLVADEVTIEDRTPEWAAIALLGLSPATAARLSSAARPGCFFAGRRGAAGAEGLDAGKAWEWVFPVGAPPDLAAALAPEIAEAPLRRLAREEMERRRIRAGIPAIPSDVGPRDLPNEGGLAPAALSYTKGCYLGQEIMARIKSKGRLRRELRPVSGRGPVPSAPCPLWQEGRQVGELRSAVSDESGAGFAGLAMLQLFAWLPGKPLGLEAAGPAGIEAAAPPSLS